MVALSPIAGAGWQFFSNSGTVLAGGKLYAYVAGTTTAQNTYTDSSGSTANAHPIVLDSAGRAANEVWLIATALYKFVLKDSAGTTIWTNDNVPGIVSAKDFGDFKAGLQAVGGGSLVGIMGTDTAGSILGDDTSANAVSAPDAADPDARASYAPALVTSLQSRRLYGVTLRDILGRNYNPAYDASVAFNAFLAELALEGIAITDPDNLTMRVENPLRPQSGMKLMFGPNTTIRKGGGWDT